MIVHVLPSPRIALFVSSLPLAPHSDRHNPPGTRITFNNQLTPRVALPSAPSAHRSNPHS